MLLKMSVYKVYYQVYNIMQQTTRNQMEQLRHQHLRSSATQYQNNNPRKQQELLHNYLNAQLMLDTPSTTHALSNHKFAINSLAHKHNSILSKLNEQLIKAEHKCERINSKILTVREIKEEEARRRQKASSRTSMQSNTSRKLFVSIARSNSRLSEQRGNREQSSKKIKLSKYMQLRSGEKTVQK